MKKNQTVVITARAPLWIREALDAMAEAWGLERSAMIVTILRERFGKKINARKKPLTLKNPEIY